MNDDLRIESIRSKKKGQSCIISFSNGESFDCSYDLVLKYKLANNSTIPPNLFNEIKREQKIYEVKQVAYNFVSYKPRTEKLIRQKLHDKGFENFEIDYAIDFLKSFNMVDDLKFAKQFSENYIKRKSIGRNKLISELRNKGIDKSLIQEVIDEIYPEADALEIAKKAVNKKLKSIRHKPGDKQKESVIRYLQSLGFDWDIIRKVIKEELTGRDAE